MTPGEELYEVWRGCSGSGYRSWQDLDQGAKSVWEIFARKVGPKGFPDSPGTIRVKALCTSLSTSNSRTQTCASFILQDGSRLSSIDVVHDSLELFDFELVARPNLHKIKERVDNLEKAKADLLSLIALK